MTEQPRPVDGRQDGRCIKCGHASGDDWTQCQQSCPVPGSPHFNQHLARPEVDLLTQVAEIVRQARIEFEGGFMTAGRLEIVHAQRLLDRVYSGGAPQ